jgi:membrane-bound lytic murein transglycosylase B
MTLTRRTALLCGAASVLSACIPVPVSRDGGGAPALGPEFRPQPNADYDAWVAAFRGRARAEGITEATLDRGFAGQGFLPGVVDRDRNQTEFRRTTEDYLALVASDEDVALGRSRVGPVRSTLADIERSTGVDANVLAAIWGVETRFGTRLGEIPVISATSTLAWEGRRGRFFEAQLLAALRIIQSGDTTTDRMTGSWAGAMGHTQLMPTVYQEYAVDFRGDGRREIWSGDPTDALASTANYLVRYNWQRGRPGATRCTCPQGFDTSGAGRRNARPVSVWRGAGVRLASGGPVPDHGEAAIHAPGGANGPAWILYRNFNTILRYNPSTNYGIGIGYMATRLAGGGRLSRSFGPDETGLTQAERRELQDTAQRGRVRHRHARRCIRSPDGGRDPRLPASARACR